VLGRLFGRSWAPAARQLSTADRFSLVMSRRVSVPVGSRVFCGRRGGGRESYEEVAVWCGNIISSFFNTQIFFVVVSDLEQLHISMSTMN